MDTSARSRFTAITSGPDDHIPLDEAALLIAAEHCASLDIAAARRRLDALAARAQDRLSGAGDRARLTALIDTLSGDHGFRGNTDNYYDPHNSFLHDVLERRVGIPISLSVVYLEVARRIDLPLVGINFPGHFLVRYPGPERPVVLDVFAEAMEIPETRLRARVQRAYPDIDDAGAQAILTRLLRGTTRKDILARMLTNLKMIFLQRRELESAIAAIDRILVLRPDAAGELRDRGAVYRQLECFGAALADYTRYLALRPTAADASAVSIAIVELEHLAAHVH
jgi:regulator of sirC expression with transglutaminase-like and TPR domain